MTILDQAKRDIAKFIATECYDDPYLFNRVIMRGPEPWSGVENNVQGQREWLDVIVNNRVTNLVTANAMGKSWGIGGFIMPWWAITRPGSQITVYGPSHSLVLNGVWATCLAACNGSYLPNEQWRKPAININAKERRGGYGDPIITFPNGSIIICKSSDKIERLQGIRRPQNLVITEESTGLDKRYWDALDSLNATKLIHLCNPLTKSCEAYNRYLAGLNYTGDPELSIASIRVSAFDSPHANYSLSPWGLASKSLIEDFRRNYGEHSPEYRARILAEWPSDDFEYLFTPDLISRSTSMEAAEKAKYYREREPYTDIIMSVDVGLEKSKTVITIRDKFGILEMISEHMTIENTALRIQQLVAKHNISTGNIIYDGNGSTGTELGLALSAIGITNAYAFFGGDCAAKWGRGMANARSSAAYALARAMGNPDRPFHIPPTLPAYDDLYKEMTAIRTISRGDGKAALEDKADLKRKLHGKSPDHIDSLCMSFAYEAMSSAR